MLYSRHDEGCRCLAYGGSGDPAIQFGAYSALGNAKKEGDGLNGRKKMHLLKFMPARLLTTPLLTVWNFPWYEPCKSLYVSFPKGMETLDPSTRELGQSQTFQQHFIDYIITDGKVNGDDRYKLFDHYEFLYSADERCSMKLHLRIRIYKHLMGCVGNLLEANFSKEEAAGYEETFVNALKKQKQLMKVGAFLNDPALPFDAYLPAFMLAAPGMEIWQLRGDWDREQHIYLVIYYKSHGRAGVFAEVFSTHFLEEAVKANIAYVLTHALLPMSLDVPGEAGLSYSCPQDGESTDYPQIVKKIVESAEIHATSNCQAFIMDTLVPPDGLMDDKGYRLLWEMRKGFWG